MVWAEQQQARCELFWIPLHLRTCKVASSLRGRVSGGEIDVNPGEFVDLDATVDDVNKAIMPLPFKEPSRSLFQASWGSSSELAKGSLSTSDLNVGDVNPNAPVGSTVALIEQGSKAFSAIHKRLHYSQGQEFKLLAKLNAEHLEESFQFSVAGSSETVFAADFDDRVDIIPVSDPNIFSTAQRIAQAQAILQMAQSAPQLHDLYEAYKRMYEAISIPNIDEILVKPEEAPRTDPIDENMSIMYGKPIKAFPEQDHEAHIAVHIQFMQDPSLAGNPAAQTMQPILIAHIAEHVALLYRQRMEASINMPLPPLPNLRDPKFALKDIDPEMDMLISQRAAQVVAAAPQMQPIKALQAAGATRPRESFGIRQAARTAGGSGSSTAHSIRDCRRPSQSKIRHRDRSSQGSPEHGHPSCQGSSRVGGQSSKAPSGVAA